jgi:hypothetical protein
LYTFLPYLINNIYILAKQLIELEKYLCLKCERFGKAVLHAQNHLDLKQQTVNDYDKLHRDMTDQREEKEMILTNKITIAEGKRACVRITVAHIEGELVSWTSIVKELSDKLERQESEITRLLSAIQRYTDAVLSRRQHAETIGDILSRTETKYEDQSGVSSGYIEAQSRRGGTLGVYGRTRDWIQNQFRNATRYHTRRTDEIRDHIPYIRTSQAEAEESVQAAARELLVIEQKCITAAYDCTLTRRELWSAKQKKEEIAQQLTELECNCAISDAECWKLLEEKRCIPERLQRLQYRMNEEIKNAKAAERKLHDLQKSDEHARADLKKVHALSLDLRRLRLYLTEEDIADVMEISYDVMQELRSFARKFPDHMSGSTYEEEAREILEIITAADDNADRFVRDTGVEISGEYFEKFSKTYGVPPSLGSVEPRADIVRRCANTMKEFAIFERHSKIKQTSFHTDLDSTVGDDNDEHTKLAKRKYETELESVGKEVYWDRYLVDRCRSRNKREEQKSSNEQEREMSVENKREILELRLLSTTLLENEYKEALAEIKRMSTEEIESRLQTTTRLTKEEMNECIQKKMAKRMRSCCSNEPKTELDMEIPRKRLAEIQEESDIATRDLQLRVLEAEAPIEKEREIARIERQILEQKRRAKCREAKDKIKRQTGFYESEEDTEESYDEEVMFVVMIKKI